MLQSDDGLNVLKVCWYDHTRNLIVHHKIILNIFGTQIYIHITIMYMNALDMAGPWRG